MSDCARFGPCRRQRVGRVGLGWFGVVWHRAALGQRLLGRAQLPLSRDCQAGCRRGWPCRGPLHAAVPPRCAPRCAQAPHRVVGGMHRVGRQKRARHRQPRRANAAGQIPPRPLAALAAQAPAAAAARHAGGGVVGVAAVDAVRRRPRRRAVKRELRRGARAQRPPADDPARRLRQRRVQLAPAQHERLHDARAGGHAL
jgi:hypothetical protein